MSTTGILRELKAERARQESKWGRQDLDSVHARVRSGNCSSFYWYGLPRKSTARITCDDRRARGDLTFADVAIKGLTEVVGSAARPDDDATREAIVRLGAVFVRWVEAIDRRAKVKELGLETREVTGVCDLDRHSLLWRPMEQVSRCTRCYRTAADIAEARRALRASNNASPLPSPEEAPLRVEVKSDGWAESTTEPASAPRKPRGLLDHDGVQHEGPVLLVVPRGASRFERAAVRIYDCAATVFHRVRNMRDVRVDDE